jgi:ribonuclease E
MLIDATHAEETRVVVLDGNRLEDFDVETSARRHLKGNIYLAKVVRVEPSLQAAFVEYGGGRHGFLAFDEIHPDYYQIPVADRQRLLEMEAEEARRQEEEEELELALSQAEAPPLARPAAQPAAQSASQGRGRHRRDRRRFRDRRADAIVTSTAEAWAQPGTPTLYSAPAAESAEAEAEAWAYPNQPALTRETERAGNWARAEAPAMVTEAGAFEFAADEPAPALIAAEAWALSGKPALIAAKEGDVRPTAKSNTAEATNADEPDDVNGDSIGQTTEEFSDVSNDAHHGLDSDASDVGDDDDLTPPEILGGDPDGVDEPEERRLPPRFLRNYKIQEVIHRRQIMLIQVVKEERGTKGAALTTYLSLAGRFGVLMPNSPRGGGISRKITSAADRRRLKEVMTELDIPRGMGLIIRTAGAARPKPEIKRDCEYLLRLWDDIRDLTMKSMAPALIYEEASLIKRAIRDVYSRDIDEIHVDGTEGWRAAHDFMRMLMPAHARKVQLWRDQAQPLFSRFQVEAQLDAMLSPVTQLRSGGYLVINQAEALVAIDVNSGRSTRERNVEETALRTNLEAADEVARQLRLRDLAGLIVIDFIDMESRRHNAMVERRLKDALRDDRARIQIGHISHFGLLEMSRQRLRPSLTEQNFVTCPHCGGLGHVRGTESAAIHVLRGIEDEASKRRSTEVIVHVATVIALYLLNHKRDRLAEIERRYGMRVIIAADESQISPRFKVERVRALLPGEAPAVITQDLPPPPIEAEEDEEPVTSTETETEAPAVEPRRAEDDDRRGRRRRRRRGRSDDGDIVDANGAETDLVVDALSDAVSDAPSDAPEVVPDAVPETAGTEAVMAPRTTDPTGTADDEDARARRRGGRRGGRRRRREGGDELSPYADPDAEQPDIAPVHPTAVYSGPTPADPFGGGAFDIFDVMEQAERAAEQAARARMVPIRAEAPPPAVAPIARMAWASAGEPRLLRDAPDEAPAGPVPPQAQLVEQVPAITVATAAEPAVKPIVIGQDATAPAERRRGWWRR